MRFIRYVLAFSCLVATAGRVAAQAPLPAPGPRLAGAIDLDAGRQCAAAHVRTAQRTATTSVTHRRKMDRYDVKYYKLDLALENNSLNVAGSVWIRLRVGAQALDSLAFELYKAPAGAPAGTATMLIDSVVVNGRRSPGIRRAGFDATAALAQPAAANSLADARIYYHGTAPSGRSAAIGNGLSTRDSVHLDTYRGAPAFPYNVTWSLSEPFSAHEWFPCKQVLTDKADSSDVWVTTTLPNKVGSNGVLVRTVPLPNNKARYEWKSRHPIDYYLISVSVAPYLEYVTTARPAGGPAVPIVSYVYNQNYLSYWQSSIARTAGFLENYSALVGLYPFANEKYGHTTAPIYGGMEHQTMTTQDGFEFTLDAHELFHQWFGDNVTCASWEHIWLNESFASYGEYLSLQAFRPNDARPWMDLAHAYARQSSGSIYVADTANVGRIFDYSLSYKKGAAVVHMLRYLLNDDTRFFRALRTYQTQYGGSTARTADLQRIFEAEAGRPLGYFFQQWFTGRGYPIFNVTWSQSGSTSLLLRVNETVTQAAFTPFFETDVDYRLTFANGTAQTVRLRQTASNQVFNVAVNGIVTAITVDPDQWVLDAPGPIPVRDNALASRAAAAAPLPVYPNPCHDQLRLPATPATTAEVRDATGRLVLRQALASGQQQLATQLLAPGLYQLRLFGRQQELCGQARFAKE